MIRSSQTQVHVQVDDVNDNAPVFRQIEYPRSINYDERIGSTIVTVKVRFNISTFLSWSPI